MIKKKLLVWSNFSRLNTGFGGHKKRVLQWFYQQPDWEVIEAAAGIAHDSPDIQKLPWKCYGLAPTHEQQAQIQAIPDEARRIAALKDANYGALNLDAVIQQEKPDYAYFCEDSWCFDNVIERGWNAVLPTIYHVTFDSLPALPQQIDMAGKVDNLYSWATFIEDEFKKYGYSHVGTIPGSVDEKLFSPISEEKKQELRGKNKIPDDMFIFSMIGRSQLRKSFPNILDGFKIFKQKNPSVKAKLFFHCSWSEGWNLPQIIKDKEIDHQDVLTTYYCKACKQWEIRPFFGANQDCPLCGAKNSFDTCNIVHGVSDEDMSLLYGISDLVFNCMTSGGYELNVWQAKLCGKITAVTNYSCGTDACSEESGGWPIDWSGYMEPASLFIKASSKPESICDAMEKFVRLSDSERQRLENKARDFAVQWSSTEAVCQKIKTELEKHPPADWSKFDWTPIRKSPTHQPPPNLSHQDFVLDLFRNVLKERVDKNNSQVKFWTEHLAKSNDYQGVYNHFVKQAADFNRQLDSKPVPFESLLDPTDEKRLLIIMPQSAGDLLMVNSLVPRIKKLYSEFRIYFATLPQFRDQIEHLPEIHRVLDYMPQMEDIFAMTGRSNHHGYFDIVMPLHTLTQKHFSYQNRRNNFRAEWLH